MLAQRARFRELALHALHTLTQLHLDAGQYDRAIGDATRLLALDPWREEAHRQLMLALARTANARLRWRNTNAAAACCGRSWMSNPPTKRPRCTSGSRPPCAGRGITCPRPPLSLSAARPIWRRCAGAWLRPPAAC